MINPLVSLILNLDETYFCVDEILHALKKQYYTKFEVVITDQTNNQKYKDVISLFKKVDSRFKTDCLPQGNIVKTYNMEFITPDYFLNLIEQGDFNGFGKHKNLAVDLLKNVINILENFKIQYCLISGTLLGYVRHGDFIPWDDDIDLLVEDRILDVIFEIKDQNQNFNFICADQLTYIKVNSIDGFDVASDEKIKLDYLTSTFMPNKWPFVDLFLYNSEGMNIKFFNRLWDKSNFFPLLKKKFLDIDVCIPANPDAFLKNNFGPEYMNQIVQSGFSHKKDLLLRPERIFYTEFFTERKNHAK